MTLRSKALTFAAIAAIVFSGAALGQSLDVVTNIGGGGPQGQPEDPTCVREGSYAMRASTPAGDDSEIFVQADSTQGFNDETVLRQEFWFNPRSITMDSGAKHFINAALQGGAGQRPLRAMLRFSAANGYSMVLQCVRNCGSAPCSYQSSGSIPIQDDWQLIRLEWAHNTAPAPAPGDGICGVSVIDGAGAPQSSVRDDMRNSNTMAGRARLGVFGNPLRDSTVGDNCFDSYQAFRTLAAP